MSWEAVAWANQQKMKKSFEQIVLLVLANCADKDGEAFVKWPYKDHWWHYLSERTRLPRSSLFRHLNTIVALGLGTKSMIILADGTRRPTIKLNMELSFDIDREEDCARYERLFAKHDEEESLGEIEQSDHHDDAENDHDISDSQLSSGHNQSQSLSGTGETVPGTGNESFPVAGMHKDSKSNSNLSTPTPPPEGMRSDQIWEDFLKSWDEPIQHMRVTREAWDRTPTEKRPTIVAAAKGFWAYRRSQSKLPAPQSAKTFIRDDAGWEQWLRYVPDPGSIVPRMGSGYPRESAEAKAIATLYNLAGALDFFVKYVRKGDAVYYNHPVTPQLLKLAEAPPREQWVKANRNQAGSWNTLLDKYRTVERRKHLVEGDVVPWEWAPNGEGKLYTSTGPPLVDGTLMTEQDMADFN